MTARILNGNAILLEIYAAFRHEIARLRAAGIIPGLAAILVGENPASKVYVTSKIAACENLGLNSFLLILPPQFPPPNSKPSFATSIAATKWTPSSSSSRSPNR